MIFIKQEAHSIRLVPNNTFPDGTSSIRISPEWDKNIELVLLWKYEGDEELVRLFYTVNHLRNLGYKHICLDVPYIPNARMDRTKNDDEVFTLKYFAEFINSLEFEKVYVRDPHSSVSVALINNVVIDNCADYIRQCIEAISSENLIMYYPDEGAMKRYSELVNRQYTFGVKKRDWRTGTILGITLMDSEIVKGKDVLIVDDICSKGGTFYHSSKALKDAGVNNIYLYVTHCENTIHKGNLLDSDLVKHIYTTNSILTQPCEKITILSR